MNWIKERLLEKTTWIGFVTIAGALFPATVPMQDTFLTLIGMVLIVIKEKKK